jgi:hypothetical protein
MILHKRQTFHAGQIEICNSLKKKHPTSCINAKQGTIQYSKLLTKPKSMKGNHLSVVHLLLISLLDQKEFINCNYGVNGLHSHN